jgi:sugar lactone lactonase YvrE
MAEHELPALRLHWMLAACLLAGCGGGVDAPGPLQAAQPCGSGACVSTVAGSGEFGTEDGPAEEARFFMPHALALDALGQLHVADFGGGNRTRLLAGGRVSTLEDDPIEFPQPADTAVDAAGERYVADTYGNRILKVLPDGTTSVVAGTGQSGDQDGDAATATFSLPAGLVFDARGTLYVADMGSRRIRRITLARAG